jgi:hypothetical protein
MLIASREKCVLTIGLAGRRGNVLALVAGTRVCRDDVALAPVFLAKLDTAGGGDGVLVLSLAGALLCFVAGFGRGLGLFCGCALAQASSSAVSLVVVEFGRAVAIAAGEAVSAVTAVRSKATARLAARAKASA